MQVAVSIRLESACASDGLKKPHLAPKITPTHGTPSQEIRAFVVGCFSAALLFQNAKYCIICNVFSGGIVPPKREPPMEEAKKRLKVYCETTFWSYLNGGRTPLEFLDRKEEFGYGN